ncbi:hypothetical protein DFH07DRAFT_756524 [Mycena maculata]|uniref:Cytochrome P450 n=1 Tax=Mycena maculata TaxID=230809 RepID=A0AAD7MRL1_9AGAR|nr:hypothetical protein DFH07DRAFT_756524 [Mycena maculata]
MGLLFAAALYANLRKRSKSKLPLSPGPRKLPLVGNMFEMPAAFQWELYPRWSKEYNSDIIHLDVAGTSIIVLGSLECRIWLRRESLQARGNCEANQ